MDASEIIFRAQVIIILIKGSIKKNLYKIGRRTKSFFKFHHQGLLLNFAQIYISNVKNQRPVKIFRLKVGKEKPEV